MEKIFASIITIGDELLIGQIVDTNSRYMAARLNEKGISVKRRVAVGDNYHDIYDALNTESSNAQIILITGGLGPTKDDITKDALLQYFGGGMVVNQGALENVRNLFEKIYKKPVTDVNLSQANVPETCEVIQNKRGSAPGMVFKKEGVIFISMPGVPYEMEGMLEDSLSYLNGQFKLPEIVHRTMLTAGIGESALAEKISNFENNLSSKIRLAYLPNYGMVRLRLSTTIFKNDPEKGLIDDQFNQLKSLVDEYLVTDEDIRMEEVLGKLLAQKGKTISTAESCTGGAMAALITSVPGSSAYFQGSIISYSNEIKKEFLNVQDETLKNFGAVSEETVKEMLQGVLNKMSTDYAIAVSGIMGPDGGAADKPVGTVWLAVGSKEKFLTKRLQQRYVRYKNIEVTSVMALNMMREFILKEDANYE